ncbi:tetratricopeptide repeat protein [Stenotrophomonas sp. 24(2023)]|uniref:YfgM family protein n=1 Tax=Stenotrophomonas sp. 24(2023) TaxID=3068324 RepID=UPI0027DF0655|nr:tetratricopeptide repeat protein [Stenotrophomonas sp. 24(2023)]WMJ68892.1 tetratricopeptide repeat protein [Stenotrophomonas sp. 24(2023)]
MAIDDLLDEHEQSERVRSWLRKNGASILGGVVIAIGAIAGWQWWQKDQGDKLALANVEYQKALTGLQQNKLDDAAKAVKALDGSTGIYGDLAALQLAKAQVDAGKNEEALATLRALKVEGDLKRVVDLRIARLLVATGKGEEAVKLLGSATDSSTLEIHGDALMAQGKRDAAREQYEKALKTLDVAAPQRRLLEIKVMDAGGTVAATPAESV